MVTKYPFTQADLLKLKDAMSEAAKKSTTASQAYRDFMTASKLYAVISERESIATLQRNISNEHSKSSKH